MESAERGLNGEAGGIRHRQPAEGGVRAAGKQLESARIDPRPQSEGRQVTAPRACGADGRPRRRTRSAASGAARGSARGRCRGCEHRRTPDDERVWLATVNGSRSSTTRRPPTPSAARCSRSSSARSPWPPSSAAAIPAAIRASAPRSTRRKAQSMPKDNIERAIKKGTGELEGVDYSGDHVRGLRPRRRRADDRGGDRQPEAHRRRRPPQAVARRRQPRRGELGRRGCSSGRARSTSTRRSTREDAMLEAALEAGAEDFAREDDQYVVTTDADAIPRGEGARSRRRASSSTSRDRVVPKNTVRVDGKDAESLSSCSRRSRSSTTCRRSRRTSTSTCRAGEGRDAHSTRRDVIVLGIDPGNGGHRATAS